ncbi:MAG: phosphoribosylaminoimidazolecarboxamide formyltransferase [Spirochaetaceae bacterium]|nr:phosphoribosylaminoimidazolecarboxamide formyltransferase [Spirochaetaceae bacterium]
MAELELRYGANPHQAGARVTASGALPFTVLGGAPGYINFLDALNSWQLVREARAATGLPAATSFKHVSPAGAALGLPLTDSERRVFAAGTEELSATAAAYARARGADRMSSYGDWVAVSDQVDLATARLLKRETSDGIIAPGYDADALDVLRAKKGGAYRVLAIDPDYRPPATERREVFGVTLEQPRNDTVIDGELLTNVPTAARDIPPAAARDMLLALIALKYTQSNSVCIAYRGQTIGIGAGQQSRIHCTALAADKACAWHLRFHPVLQKVRFRPGVRRHDRDTWMTQYVGGVQVTDDAWLRAQVEEMPPPLTAEQRADWLAGLDGAVLASDGFFPHRDSIDVARRCGVRYIVQPGGSLRDGDVIEACDEHGLAMVMTGLRLFHH